MPPKVKTTKEAIVSTAVEIVREQGVQALNARAVAAILGCSTQPIFSNFATMEELRLAVVYEADVLYNHYIRREVENGEYPEEKLDETVLRILKFKLDSGILSAG